MCKNKVVEDEIHFLCECDSYSVYRNEMFEIAKEADPSFTEKDNIDKFVFLMSNHQKSVIYYLTKAISKRTNTLSVSIS